MVGNLAIFESSIGVLSVPQLHPTNILQFSALPLLFMSFHILIHSSIHSLIHVIEVAKFNIFY